MNCKHCDYPLWNIRSRRCPECGEEFLPSQFRFARNSVRFRCPHCTQDYYGSGHDGHLVPRAFNCVACAKPIDMDEMVLLPAEGVEERETRADINPWLDEDKRMLARWVATLGRGVTNPAWLLRVTPIETEPGQAWGFAIFTLFLFAGFTLIPLLLLAILFSFAASALMGAGLLSILGVSVGSLVFMGVWIVCTHGMLRLGGRTAGGMGRSAQAICFTCAPMGFLLVPCLGHYLGWIGVVWWMIAAGFALASAQRVSAGRAALAITAFPVLCIAVLIAALALFVSSTAIRLSGANPGAWGAQGAPMVQQFSAPLRSAAAAGSIPLHAGELILNGSILPAQFVSPFSRTMPSDAAIAGVSLERLAGLRPDAQRAVIADAVAAMPTDVAAHRVGDFVFLLDALAPPDPEPELWIAIEAWDPRFNRSPVQFSALTAGGLVEKIHRDALQSALDRQNAARAGRGLPPLPHPQTVRAAPPPD